MQKSPFQPTPLRILVACLLGAMIGCPAGALGLLAWALFRDPFFLISVGSGLLGVLYMPLVGGAAGSLVGAVVGGVLTALGSRRRAK